MSHPFEVGKTYRNRVGEYVVISIDEDEMKIRYVDGGTLQTNAQIQARIWENIQFEERAARADERRRLAQEARLAARRRTRQMRARPEFGGFQESDFETKARGIAWKNRQQLGKVLAYELRQRTKATFGQWIVPRKPSIHVARKDQYNSETRERNAAFFVSIDEEGVCYGFRVGKPAGAAKSTWSWSRFTAELAEGEQTRGRVRAAMEKHALRLDIYAMETKYGLVGRVTPQPEDGEFLWQQETADQEVVRSIDWDGIAAKVRALTAEGQSELQLAKQVAPGVAVERGSAIVEELLSAFQDLLPIYDTSVSL